MLRCGNIPKGHVFSLTVIHDLGEGLDKVSREQHVFYNNH